MRLLHLIDTLHLASGGPVEGLREMSAEQIRQGHTTQILTLDEPGSEGHERFAAPIIALGSSSRSPFCFNIRVIPWLRENRSTYDAILVHGVWGFHALAAWLSLRGSGTPYFVYSHGALDPWFRAAPARHLKRAAYWQLFGQHIFNDAAGVLYLTEQERLQARNAFAPYHCTELLTSYGTALPHYSEAIFRHNFLKSYPETRGKRVLLSFSNNHEKDGAAMLLDAFSRVAQDHPELHLVIGGACDARHAGKLRAKSASLSNRVTWTGAVSPELRFGAMHAADAFILPSHCENFAFGAVEAMARGVPVLLSSRVQIHQQVLEYKAGFAERNTIEGTTRLIESTRLPKSGLRCPTAPEPVSRRISN